MGVMCQILLNKPREGIYRPGQPVVGTIKYGFDKPTELKDIVLSFIGEGKCEWSESSSSTNSDGSTSSSTTWYTGKEEYVSQSIHLLPSKETVTLNIGMYEHQFKFNVPENVPSSCKDIYCCISYKIYVRFVKPRLFSFAKVFETEVVVYGYVYPTTTDGPIIFGLKKSLFKPFSFKEQVVELKAEIAKTCLAPGQNADLKFVIKNDSKVKIPSIRTKLVCQCVYTANCGRTNRVIRTLDESTVDSASVPENSVANLLTVVPILPRLYSIQNSKIINKEYKLLVVVRLPMPHIDACVDMPIVIGERRNDEQTEIDYLEDEPPPSYWEAMADVTVTEKK